MPNILINLDRITGETQILDAIEKLSFKTISDREAFEKISEVFKINLEYFSIKKNIHNAGVMESLIAAKLFPSNWLSKALIKKINRGEPIEFREDNIFGERITELEQCISFTENDDFPPAITRGCAVLVLKMRIELLDNEIIKALDKLDTYIESTGDLPRPEDFREYSR